MPQLIEDTEVFIPADAWATLTPPAPPAPIDDMVAAFLAAGGKIHQVDPGVSATDVSGVRVLTMPSTKFDAHQQLAHATAKASKRSRQARAGDLEAVALVKAMLPTASSAVAIANALYCTEDKLQRLLREYFADEPMADRFRRLDRDARNKEVEDQVVPAVRKAIADGMVGIYAIAKHVGICTKRLNEINVLYRLNIPKAKTGRKGEVV